MAKRKKKKAEKTKAGKAQSFFKRVAEGWRNRDITGGFGQNYARKYRAKKGRRDLLRIIDPEPIEYFVHPIDDVAVDKDGKEVVFYVTCAKTWNEETEEWEGECKSCDREYDRVPRYATRLIHLASRTTNGKEWIPIPESESPKLWDFGGDKYRAVSDVQFQCEEADPPTELRSVEIIVDCDDSEYQKVRLGVSMGKSLLTRAHIAAFAELKNELLKILDPGTPAQQESRLKKRRGSGVKKVSVSKKSRTDEEEPTEEESDDSEASTGDDELDALLAEL